MKKSSGNRYYSGPVSNNFDGKRFFLAGENPPQSAISLFKWLISGKREKWPKSVDNVGAPPPRDIVTTNECMVTFIGHATVLIQLCGINILTDPFLSSRASPVQFAGPKRARSPGIALEDLPKIDYVLLSHNHFDHLDLASLKRLHAHCEPTIITPLGNAAIINKTGCDHTIIEGDWGTSVSLNNEIKVTLTPASHWSKRTLRDRNMALWCAFLLQTPLGPIYFAGDTGYGSGGHFRAIYQEFGAPRIAFLPIGAYEPRWFMKDMHMNPDDAVKAHIDLTAHQSVAFHHGTVQLTDEAMGAPVEDLQVALEKHSVKPDDFIVLGCGESKKFG